VEPEFDEASFIMGKLMAIHADVQRILEILEVENEEENDDRS
jgi:hypothetical protein